MQRLRIILHGGTSLVQKVQSLINLALGICRVRTLPGRYCLNGDASAGILTAIYVAVAPAAARIANRTSLTSASLFAPLATGLNTLTRLTLLLAGLTALTGLAIATELAGLTLSILTLTRLSVGLTSAETCELVAQTG